MDLVNQFQNYLLKVVILFMVFQSEPNGELLENTNFKWLKADITKLDELEKEFQKLIN